MYYLFLFLAAFLIISLFTSFWPVKLYHHWLLKKLADALNSFPEKRGLVFSNVYSEITTSYQGRDFRIRFVEGSADSLKSSSGLEIRMKADTVAVLECYPLRRHKREWGDFKRFLTGNSQVDNEWFILSDNPDKAAELWGTSALAELLSNRNFFLEQLSLTHGETVARLRRFHSPERVMEVMETLSRAV